MHSIPEGLARDIIARTFREAGVTPETDRFVHLAGDTKNVRLEVAAAGHKFGVAYLTSADLATAGDGLPPRGDGDSLVIATGEGGARILFIFADDYVEDDASGDDRTATAVTAHRRLQRDVRDFLHRAEIKEWP